jgi:hypothetical protein
MIILDRKIRRAMSRASGSDRFYSPFFIPQELTHRKKFVRFFIALKYYAISRQAHIELRTADSYYADIK